MRITDILFVRQALPRRLFSGRNRLPREVSSFNKKQVLSKLVDEEEALFYLRQPYLTKEQEDLYIKNVELPRETSAHLIKRKTIYNHVTLKERMEFLKIKSQWE
ncbi:hypothetical protein CHUAL_012933 [Chamberlinius hualienensis]